MNYRELVKLTPVKKAEYSANGYRSRRGYPASTRWVPLESGCGYCSLNGVACGLLALRQRFQDIQDIDSEWRRFIADNEQQGEFNQKIQEPCKLP